VAGQRIGYVRVSTLDQNERRQLGDQVLDRVFTDKASGRDTSRPELTELLRFARNGDTVVVHSMDRLARNLDDLRALVQGLTRKGVRVEFLKENLVFTCEDPSHRNGRPNSSSGQPTESPNPSSPATTASAGKRSTNTCAKPNFPKALPRRPGR
jgi:DNA invertase Pin-like site-specific DNA recombinase